MMEEQVKRIKAFFKAANYSDAVLDRILTIPEEDDQEPEDVNTIAQEHLSTQETLIIDKSGLFTEADVDTKFSKYRNSLKSQINKSLSMGLTRSELSELKMDGVLSKVSDFHKDAVTAASAATDQELKDENHELKVQNASLQEKVDGIEDLVSTQVAERTSVLEAERNEEKVVNLFNSLFAKDKYKWAEGNKGKRDQFYIEQTMRGHVEIHGDGKVTQNGGKQAVNFAGNGHLETLEDGIDELYAREQMHPKHRGGGGGGGRTRVGKIEIEDPEKAPATMDMAKRIEQYETRKG